MSFTYTTNALQLPTQIKFNSPSLLLNPHVSSEHLHRYSMQLNHEFQRRSPQVGAIKASKQRR